METIAAIVSAVVAAIALFLSWRLARKADLRVTEVLAWSNEVIKALRTLHILCGLDDPIIDEQTARSKMRELLFETSALVDRGRLFFKNERVGDHGSDKEQSFRKGYRAAILDPIVTAHRIAEKWFTADQQERQRLKTVTEKCVWAFLDLAVEEVRRKGTLSSKTRHGGAGDNLDLLLEEAKSPPSSMANVQ